MTTIATSHVPAAVDALLRAHEYMGAEHHALLNEEGSAKDGLSTVRGMRQATLQTIALLCKGAGSLTKVHGMRALGIDGQPQRGIDHRPYHRAIPMENIAEVLIEATECVRAAVDSLEGMYVETKKHPALAQARRPLQMRYVLHALRETVDALTAELTGLELCAEAEEFAMCSDQLERLLARLCRTIPAPSPELASEAVATAILADPHIAEAAAAAVKHAVR